MRRFVCTIALASLAAAEMHAAVPKKRTGTRAASRSPAKPDPVDALIGGIALNILRPGQPLNATCSSINFKALAFGLHGMEGKISREKSEYETDAEFRASQAKLEGIINDQRLLAVCQPLDDNEDAPFRYDAEREVFSGSFDADQNVWRDSKSLGSYASRTRMGIRMTIKASVDFEYDVTFGSSLRNLKSDCVSNSYRFEYTVPVPREEAPLVKARGRLVFVGRLVSPFISSSESAGNPSLDNPYDVYTRTLTVHFEPQSVAVVGPTGKEYWRCKLLRSGASGAASALGSTTLSSTGSPSGPRPRGSTASWVTNDDYPPSALRDGATGTTVLKLAIAVDGRVEGCSVQSSSGSAFLDETTCRLLQRRARYEPAIGPTGAAVPSSDTYTHNWTIPK